MGKIRSSLCGGLAGTLSLAGVANAGGFQLKENSFNLSSEVEIGTSSNIRREGLELFLGLGENSITGKKNFVSYDPFDGGDVFWNNGKRVSVNTFFDAYKEFPDFASDYWGSIDYSNFGVGDIKNSVLNFLNSDFYGGVSPFELGVFGVDLWNFVGVEVGDDGKLAGENGIFGYAEAFADFYSGQKWGLGDGGKGIFLGSGVWGRGNANFNLEASLNGELVDDGTLGDLSNYYGFNAGALGDLGLLKAVSDGRYDYSHRFFYETGSEKSIRVFPDEFSDVSFGVWKGTSYERGLKNFGFYEAEAGVWGASFRGGIENREIERVRDFSGVYGGYGFDKGGFFGRIDLGLENSYLKEISEVRRDLVSCGVNHDGHFESFDSLDLKSVNILRDDKYLAEGVLGKGFDFLGLGRVSPYFVAGSEGGDIGVIFGSRYFDGAVDRDGYMAAVSPWGGGKFDEWRKDRLLSRPGFVPENFAWEDRLRQESFEESKGVHFVYDSSGGVKEYGALASGGGWHLYLGYENEGIPTGKVDGRWKDFSFKGSYGKGEFNGRDVEKGSFGLGYDIGIFSVSTGFNYDDKNPGERLDKGKHSLEVFVSGQAGFRF